MNKSRMLAALAIDGATHVPVVSLTASRRSVRMILNSAKKRGEQMEYLIVAGVVATMSLYVVIIARCLKEPEW
jgi:hypothetical protein